MSKSGEPALVEVPFEAPAGSTAVDNVTTAHPLASMNDDGQLLRVATVNTAAHVKCNAVRRPLSINQHIERLLAQINQLHADYNPCNVTSKKNPVAISDPTEPKASVPTVASCSKSHGKFAHPSSSLSLITNKRHSESSSIITQRPLLPKPGTSMSTFFPTISQLVTSSVTSQNAVPTVSSAMTTNVSTKKCKVKTTHVSIPAQKGDPACLSVCQTAVDGLSDVFHQGIDKMVAFYGESLFGAMRFDPTLTPSPMDRDTSQDQSPFSITTAVGTQLHTNTTLGAVAINQAATIFPPTCLLTASRFLNRCKARGESTTTDLFSLPSSVSFQSQSMIDEFDVRRARSFLDRCRVCLPRNDYSTIVLTLGKLHRSLHNASVNTVINALKTVLTRLKQNQPLWEDFIRLLTPDQARRLCVLTVYMNLKRVDRVQRVMADLVPRGKRFWRRISNLADCRALLYERMGTTTVTTDSNPSALIDATHPSPKKPPQTESWSIFPSSNKLLTDRHRKFHPKQHSVKSVPFRSKSLSVNSPLTQTWNLLEGTWRNRPVLITLLSTLLNTHHKPYAGFEQVGQYNVFNFQIACVHSICTFTLLYFTRLRK